MKAKEWVEKFKAAWPDIHTVLLDFVDETMDIISKRGGTTNAITGAFREQMQKFRAICNIFPDLFMELFEDACEEQYPATFKVWCEATKQEYIRKRKRVASAQFHKELKEARNEPDPEIRLLKLRAAVIEWQMAAIELKKELGD